MNNKGLIIILLLFILTLVPFHFFSSTSTLQLIESESIFKEFDVRLEQNQEEERQVYTSADDQYLYQNPQLITSKFLIDVPLIEQNPELPRGCEVTSLAMLLNHAGIVVDKMTLAEQIKKVPFDENGLKGNPNDGFVGSMYTFDEPGLGVYHGPIFELAEQYLPNRIVDLTGSNFEEIIVRLKDGKPIWVIANTWYSYVPETYWFTWKTSSGDIQITYQEHSVVLTGFDKTYVYFNDPLAVAKDRKVLKKEFEKAYNQMGKQAITYID